MPAARVRSLDIEAAQILSGCDDSAFYWHHRILVFEVGSGMWVAISPDLEACTCDLREAHVIALGRDTPFPTRTDTIRYVFDALDDTQWEAAMLEATALARVLGVKTVTTVVPGPKVVWRYSDPAQDIFDTEVDIEEIRAVHNDNLVVKDNVGLYNHPFEAGRRWMAIEKVDPTRHSQWLEGKRSGPGRDLRIAPVVLNAGRRFTPLASSLNLMRPTIPKDCFFRGPPACGEMLQGVHKSGHELATYDGMWAARSGVAKGSAVAHSHRNLCTALSLMQSYDQLDMGNSAAAEFLARWSLMVEAAVRKNPKAPSFTGLEAFLSHSFDELGGVITPDFTKHIADEQRAEAQVMKQHRLWQEEQDAAEKSTRGGGPNNNQNNKKRAAGEAGGAG